LNVPAVAVNPADVAPDDTLTEAGTVSTALLLERDTAIPPVPAACDRVTVHADVPLALRVVGEQDTWLTTVAAVSENDAVCELPL
jgi:hypothetical protein